MTTMTEAITLVVLAAICAIGEIVLGVTGHDSGAAQTTLRDIALVAIGGGAGVARQQFTNRR